jgi:ferredoxin
MAKESKQLFHEDTKTVTPSGIETYKFDPSKHTYAFSLVGNTKMGAIASWSTLLGDYRYMGLDGDLDGIKGTCKNCGACKMSCYVRSSYRFPGVVQSQAINTWGLRHELKKVEADLAAQIERRHVKDVRINQSGEIENQRQFAMWCRLAIRFPETNFYVYTKMYDIVGKFLDNGDVPPNFTILFSVWHEHGAEEYKKYSHLPNVKAFVYDDGVNCHLPTKCYCPAYKVIGKSGKAKMDHSVSCETCRLCIDSKLKVIACHEH